MTASPFRRLLDHLLVVGFFALLATVLFWPLGCEPWREVLPSPAVSPSARCEVPGCIVHNLKTQE
jgi:hypothetical protein